MTADSSLPPLIRTTRLVLRRQDPDAAALIKDAVDSSLAHLQAAVAWAQSAPMSLTALREHLTRTATAFDAGTAWAFSIFDAEETRILGGAGLEPADDALSALVGPGTFETGYWLRADATGHGYASEATAALIELAFARLDARRVAICHDPANRASKGVPERLGFRCIGTVTHDQLPGRQTADGSARLASTVWVIEAAGSTQRHTVDLSPSRSS